MICDKKDCTACGACKAICPKSAINLESDDLGTLYPVISEDLCINCGLCNSVCPNNNEILSREVKKVFASYSLDKSVFNNAASGGIASEIYKLALKNEYFIMGTFFSRTDGVTYKKLEKIEDIEWACSSKYVYSDMTGVYEQYLIALNNGKTCIFIGLSCQCSGLINFINKKAKDKLVKLITVNIICHGVPNWLYLDKHLSYLERKTFKIENIKFRSKELKCENQMFVEQTFDYHLKCLSGDNQILYIKDMHKAEPYGNAFLNNLIFRENCYSCKYARPERIGDITIGDYDGLGTSVPYTNSVKTVSCVLITTTKGEHLLEAMQDSLYLEPRPLEEPFRFNYNLNYPSKPHKNRNRFIKNYLETKDFEKSVQKSLFKEMYLSVNLMFDIKAFIKAHFNFIYKIYKTLGK